MSATLNIAVRAARTAGALIVRYVDRVDTLRVNAKAMNDFVSDVDREAERRIVEVIHRAYPGHAILAEEGGSRGTGDSQWIIDPLDGTTNFLHGFPQYAVSIAFRYRGLLEDAVVFDPISQELFTATRGAGARLGERRIRVSRRPGLEGALIGTGFPFRDHSRLDAYLATLRAVIADTAGVRRAGAAALDLAYVAAGRLDGFWEFGLSPWDIAAGVLLIQEAGGMVSEPDGAGNPFDHGDILAGAPRVHAALVQRLAPLLGPVAAR